MFIADTREEQLGPGTIFKSLETSFRDVASEGVLDEITQELRSSADNQGEINVDIARFLVILKIPREMARD